MARGSLELSCVLVILGINAITLGVATASIASLSVQPVFLWVLIVLGIVSFSCTVALVVIHYRRRVVFGDMQAVDLVGHTTDDEEGDMGRKEEDDYYELE
jgi:hypothetical protein